MNTRQDSFKGLLSELGDNISTLFRMEFELAKAESSEKVTQFFVACGAIAGGVVLALAALVILLEALVIALTTAGLSPGWSALIVGGAAAAIAFGIVMKGISDLRASNLMPNRTFENLQRDAQTIKEHTP